MQRYNPRYIVCMAFARVVKQNRREKGKQTAHKFYRYEQERTRDTPELRIHVSLSMFTHISISLCICVCIHTRRTKSFFFGWGLKKKEEKNHISELTYVTGKRKDK